MSQRPHKPLSEMSLEELWQLFPIRLTPHAPRWKTQYTKEAQSIFTILSTLPIFRISHIGSTAVPEIHAKPIVDILLEIPKQSALTDYKNILTAHDWICMSENEKRISFNKGYTPEGYAEEVYHLHLRFQGDNDELYFRDFLIDHSETAKEYERLKLSLWKRYEFDRDGYTKAKTAFIEKYTNAAKLLYPNRY